jgi:hypothetical protein
MSETDQTPKQPCHDATTRAAKAAREARLADAMRANLRKRRRQQEERRSAEKSPAVKPA